MEGSGNNMKRTETLCDLFISIELLILTGAMDLPVEFEMYGEKEVRMPHFTGYLART